MDDGLRRECGAPLNRGNGFCKQPAGRGTGHRGKGYCSTHGGKGEFITDAAFETAPDLMNRAAAMTPETQEEISHATVAGYVICRAVFVQNCLQFGITAKEANDWSLAATRYDKLIKASPQGDNPDEASNAADDETDAELKRLLAIG